MKQTDVDLLLARAQIALAFLFAGCIFALVFLLILFHTQIEPTTLTIITTVLTALVTILTLIANFFYARQRPAALPDPNAPPSAPTLSITTSTPSPTTPGAPDAPAATQTTTVTSRPAPPAAPGNVRASS